MKKEGFEKYRVKRLSRESIEAEEIFLDSKKIKESPESEREKLEFPIKKGRIYFLYSLIVILILILLVKVINLQIIQGNYWRTLAEENRIRSYPIKALRGIIYDKYGRPLVSNEPSFDLKIVPADLLKQEEKLSEILKDLSEILKVPKESIETPLRENNSLSVPIAIKEGITRKTALILEGKFAENPAILIEIASQRNYIDDQYFSHILGYLGRVTQKEYKKYPNYLLDDYIGKTGLEFHYETLLRGLYGETLIEVDSYGKIKNIFARKESQPGKDLILSIDSELQKKLYKEIQQMLWNLKTDRAAAIVLNPDNGRILALVSFPSFNNNEFIQGFSKEKFQKIAQSSSKPLFNRAISGTYPPGSTIKPIIAAAALKEGIITPNEPINCPGFIIIQHKYYPDIFYTFHDWKTHGSTNLIKAIAESCNVYFYTIGGGYGKIKGLGIEKISQYLKQFGLGNISGIDLPGEIRGLIPDEDWKQKNKNEGWYVGDTYNVSIGQGDLMITPLQISLATSIIANNGTLFKPQLVSKIGKNENPSQIIKNNIISKEIIDTVKRGMKEAVISGSAKYLYDLPVKVAGKTGTAQASGNKAPHSWFTGFAPYDNPKIVITILIENGGEGSAAAVPVAKEVLRWYFSKSENL